jgi:alkylation response protein AidB-like acyl-CoA dehydrogenase
MRADDKPLIDLLPQIEANAPDVDRDAAFPVSNIRALADAGFLGLVSSTEVGGSGGPLRAAVDVVRAIGRCCGSTAMVTCMHYCAVAVIEKYGTESVRREIAAGRHLSTLAFSEPGSRSHFWASLGTADAKNGVIELSARKSWVTSAHHADTYVWSSKPVSGTELSTLWLVPRTATGIQVHGQFDGLGLRGNESCPVTAVGVQASVADRLGGDGEGFSVMIGTVLPWFNLLSSAICTGLMESAVEKAVHHAASTLFQESGTKIADLAVVRANLARMRIRTDQVAALTKDAVDAVSDRRADATLRVLECKAAAGDGAAEVTDLAMRVCGGAAFRRELGVERVFRDSRAAQVMAPTSDVLHDFIGKAICGMPLF